MECRARVEQRDPLTAGHVTHMDLRVRVLLNAGRLPEANAVFDEVVTKAPPSADRWVRSAVLVHRAVMAWRLGRQDDDRRWPMVLWLADQDPAATEMIARLWSRALIAPGADHGVRVVLRTWAQWAERNPEQRPAFIKLFAAVPRSQRQADLLTTLAGELRTGKPPSPDTARNLIDALTKGR